jgi:hypothetical protein
MQNGHILSISNNLGKHPYEPSKFQNIKCASNFKKRILGKIKKIPSVCHLHDELSNTI